MAEKFTVDGDAVRALAQLLNETNLNEIEYQVGTHRVKVQRSPDRVVSLQPAAAAPIAAQAPVPVAEAAPAQPAASASGETISSPMVGTVYLKPDPDAANFVKPGDTVQEGDTLLIVEAMKVMNPIKAPRSGKVVEILIADASPVEFGEALVILQ